MLLQWSLILLFVSTYVLGQYTNTWAVEVHGGLQAADQLARKYGCENRGQVGCLEDTFEFVYPESEGRGKFFGGAPDTAAMKNEKNVAFVEQQVKRKRVKKSYVAPTDPLWRDQWPLLNTGQITGSVSEVGRSIDLNVEPVWIQGITGCSSVVAIVDDGVEYTHSDLRENYARDLGYDYIHRDKDPLPTGPFDGHGTAVAGIIGMSKDNGVCGVGVAYGSTITGIRLLDLFQLATDLDEANSLGHKSDIIEIYSNSWGPIDDGSVAEGPGRLLQRTFEMGVRQGREGKGSIYVWASGNGGSQDSCAADGYTSSIYTIGIGAATSSASQPSYDEDCSGKMAVAFVSDDNSDELHVTTADTRNRCTGDFDGTSASTPLTSGVIALALEANRNLTWRDVQYLIAYTSNRDSLTGGDWATNGAGLRVSHKFGFGAIDAEAMVTRARHWISVPEQQKDTFIPSTTSGTADFSNDLLIIFSYNGSIRSLEHVVASMSLTVSPGALRGNIRIDLTSPSGTNSVLLPERLHDFGNSYIDWPFMSVHFWGEDPIAADGLWTLRISYNNFDTLFVALSNLSVTFYGTTEVPEAVRRIPATCDPACVRGCADVGPEFCDQCVVLRDAASLECITADDCPQGFAVRNGYCYNSSLPEPGCSRASATGLTVSFLSIALYILIALHVLS